MNYLAPDEAVARAALGANVAGFVGHQPQAADMMIGAEHEPRLTLLEVQFRAATCAPQVCSRRQSQAGQAGDRPSTSMRAAFLSIAF
jgi:hypothetical protein